MTRVEPEIRGVSASDLDRAMVHLSSVSVLIVNFNTRQLVCSLLDSLKCEQEVISEIIVVDNASTDGSVAKIRTDYPEVKVIELAENVGFGRANNLSASIAVGQRFLLLNSDTIVVPGAVRRLVEFANKYAAAGIWGGRTTFPDNRLNPTSCWRRMSLWSVFCRAIGLSSLAPKWAWSNPEAYCGWERDSVRAVDIVSGCFFMIEQSLWKKLDGFDPAFFMYGEEVDLCLRARALGANPMFTPEATIIHVEGASRTSTFGPTIQILAARIRNIQLHFLPWQRRLGIIMTQAGALFRWFALNLLCVVNVRWRNRRDDWREAMRRRDEWWNGYPNSSLVRDSGVLVCTEERPDHG